MHNLDEFAKEYEVTKEEVLRNDNDLLDAFYDTYTFDVAFTKEDTITELGKKLQQPNFNKAFDATLMHISDNPKNAQFSVETEGGEKRPLFTEVCELVEKTKRNAFAMRLYEIISSEKFDFGEAFEESFDFYSTIFEYLIKDYNVASGTYASNYA